MSKIISALVFILTGFSVFSLFSISTVKAQAQVDIQTNLFMVNTVKGLNVRDKKCTITNTESYASLLYVETEGKIRCNVGGQSFVMARVNSMGENYVAEKFLVSVMENKGFFPNQAAKVTPSAGLNLRDDNCKKIATISFNTVLPLKGSKSNSPVICRAQGKLWHLMPVEYNGRYGYVAAFYLAAV
jgi:hypothetical protein